MRHGVVLKALYDEFPNRWLAHLSGLDFAWMVPAKFSALQKVLRPILPEKMHTSNHFIAIHKGGDTALP